MLTNGKDGAHWKNVFWLQEILEMIIKAVLIWIFKTVGDTPSSPQR